MIIAHTLVTTNWTARDDNDYEAPDWGQAGRQLDHWRQTPRGRVPGAPKPIDARHTQLCMGTVRTNQFIIAGDTFIRCNQRARQSSSVTNAAAVDAGWNLSLHVANVHESSTKVLSDEVK